MITQDITVKGLSPSQIQQLQQFVQHVLVDDGVVIYSRPGDVRRTANELVNTGLVPPPPPPAHVPHPATYDSGMTLHNPGTPPLAPAPAAAPSPAPAAVTAPATTAGPAAAPGAADARGVPHHPDHHAALTSSNGGRNPDGSWKKRRGHKPEALAAYEAPYLAPQRQAEAAAIANPTLDAVASAVAAPAPGLAPSTVAEAPAPFASSAAPTASFTPPTPNTSNGGAVVAGVPSAAPASPSAAEMFGAPVVPGPAGGMGTGAAYAPPVVTYPLPGTQPLTPTNLEQLWAHLAMHHRVGSQHEAHMVSTYGGRPGADIYRTDAMRLSAAYNWLYQFMPVA